MLARDRADAPERLRGEAHSLSIVSTDTAAIRFHRAGTQTCNEPDLGGVGSVRGVGWVRPGVVPHRGSGKPRKATGVTSL